MVAGTVRSAAVRGAAAWDVVVGDRFIAAVAAPAPDDCMSALADAASDPLVSVESLVGSVPTGARGAVDSFAIVYWHGPGPTEVTAVVRGDAVVDLSSPGGTRRFDARGIRPWHLAEFDAVVALRLTASDAPLDRLGEAPDVVGHARASLRASTIEWAAAAGRPRATEAATADADTVLMLRRRTPPLEPAAESPVESALPAEHAAADTILTRRRSSAAERPLVVTDGRTPAASEAPAAPLRPDASTVPGAPCFRIGDGPVQRLTSPVLIGRRPLAPRVPASSGSAPRLVTVDSPTQLVSATHLELKLEGTRLVATDLRSTNGTVVRTPAGSRRMRAGESIVVMPGSSLDLGDGTIIEIVPASAVSPE